MILFLLIWTFPWAIIGASFGVFSNGIDLLIFSGLTFAAYALASKQLCLLSLKTTKPVNSPIMQRVGNKIKLIEVQSPKRAVYLFKGYPGDTGIIAITSAELSVTTEFKLQKMITHAEKSLMKSQVWVWTWVFPFYKYLFKTQDMLTGVITARGLVQGLFWYAPYRLVRSITIRHRQEFPNVDSVI
ncbi:MAG: hypothetical protein KA715_01340 [Xanthomonadaceae bacterium]|nr:hypothetical protein [Xanthomonadaceae bacterium]